MTEREMVRTVRLLKIHRSIKSILAIAFIISAIWSTFRRHYIVVKEPDTGTVMIIEMQRR